MNKNELNTILKKYYSYSDVAMSKLNIDDKQYFDLWAKLVPQANEMIVCESMLDALSFWTVNKYAVEGDIYCTLSYNFIAWSIIPPNTSSSVV